MCALTDKQWTCALQSIEIVQLATWLRPKVVWWLRSAQLHSHPKHLPRGSHGHLGCLLVTISLVDASSNFEGEAQVLLPQITYKPMKNTSNNKKYYKHFFVTE